jgi:hypothetical protein
VLMHFEAKLCVSLAEQWLAEQLFKNVCEHSVQHRCISHFKVAYLCSMPIEELGAILFHLVQDAVQVLEHMFHL